jgi:hypothetical protein
MNVTGKIKKFRLPTLFSQNTTANKAELNLYIKGVNLTGGNTGFYNENGLSSNFLKPLVGKCDSLKCTFYSIQVCF